MMGLYPTSAWEGSPPPFAKQLAALALQSVLQTYAMTYVSPVIVFSPPPLPPPPPPQIRIYDSHLQQKQLCYARLQLNITCSETMCKCAMRQRLRLRFTSSHVR